VGDVTEAGQVLATFDPFAEPIIAEQSGTINFIEIVQGLTLREELNEDTGVVERKIDLSSEASQPRIEIVNSNNEVLSTYYLPNNAYIDSSVEDGASVKAGDKLARILKESQKSQDITGGLPRVSERFEARRLRNAAVLAAISGKIHFRGIVKGKRLIVVEDAFGDEKKHLVPMGKYLYVRDGDTIEAGEAMCDGPIDVHDLLLILGEGALQRFLMNEIQEVYRMQGVVINDKHIGVIIRQMMRKVEIVEVGDTHFIYGQQVDKFEFHTQNEAAIASGGNPAIARPLLLGVTRASLNIGSFISAASFQETTKVLTNAAIAGDVDNLRGLKENVIIGHLIPAGTGMKGYRNVKLYDSEHGDLDEYTRKVVEQKRLEEALARQAENDAINDDTSLQESFVMDKEEEGFSEVSLVEDED
jgi:DNA-directed RNA polymerase subunit beta'